VFIRSPELLTHAQRMGEYLRFRCTLSGRISEFVILLVARDWTQDYEFGTHRKHGLKAGLTDAIVDAIREGRRPDGLDEELCIVWDFVAELLRATVQPAALCGLSAGFFFALTSVLVKAANQALPGDDPILRALVTLVVANILQTSMQGGWLLAREPDQARAVFTTWRTSAQVGALSACGSACWFTAFALAPVALVRAVGQVEIIFTLLFSRFYLKERPSAAEIIGVCVGVVGVVLVLIGR
jgi:uncharacterized membrane protein